MTYSRDAQYQRVGNPDRAARGKALAVESLLQFEEQWSFAAVPRANCMEVDTTDLIPAEVAMQILQHFDIKGNDPLAIT